MRLLSEGVTSTIVNLKAFDYLLSDNIERRFVANTICFAGDLRKSGFLEDLGMQDIPYHLNLYGAYNPHISNENIVYKGKFEPDDISFLEGEWGLLWDGTSCNTCNGNFGEYLRIICPHKLSLYIASKLLIIAWSESAMAKFVLGNGIGIVIDDLSEIPEKLQAISPEDKKKMRCKIEILSMNLRKGNMFLNALKTAETLI